LADVSTEQSNSEISYNQWANSVGYATGYGYDISKDFNARLKYKLAGKYCHPGFDVLDVGCANGIHMRLLAAQCRSITGIDINDDMLKLASTNLAEEGFENVTVTRQSATHMEFKNDSFDLVYSFSTLLLVLEIDDALSEIVRVLRPGGIAILEITGRHNLSRVYWERYYRRSGCFGMHSYSYGRISRRLNELGIDIIERHATGFTDQWKYIPGLRLWKWPERLLNGTGEVNLDYRLSNFRMLFPFANRWYMVCRKRPYDSSNHDVGAG
jgi:SAM-dependent methyltransferase